MVKMATAKYVRQAPTHQPLKKGGALIPYLNSDGTFGSEGFNMYWQAIKKPTVMHPDPHTHDFNQYLIFLGDTDDLLDLRGEVEMTLSLDGKKLEKHAFTKATQIYIPAGLYHCPLNFKKVTKPIIFIDIFFAKEYKLAEQKAAKKPAKKSAEKAAKKPVKKPAKKTVKK